LGVWGNLLLFGLLVWLLCLIFGDAHRAWRAVLINFIYFVSLAGGMVVWPAAITAARGEHWLNDRLRRPALLSLGFAPVSLAAFFLLFLGRWYWAGWLHAEHLHNGAWLNSRFLFMRDLAALLLFWGMAAWSARDARPQPGKARAGWLAFIYCAVFSLLGFDLVMALDPHWVSSLFGGYFFITGMYIAVNGWTLSVLMLDPPMGGPHRKDMGKLVVAFSLLSTYMMFCQLIPIWYESLPEEIRFVIPRLRQAPWNRVSLLLLPTVYLGPLVFLLSNRLKGSITYLRALTLMVLVGMWFERWWLVTPTLGGKMALGLPEISMTAAFLGAFMLSRIWGACLIPIPEEASTGSAGHSREGGSIPAGSFGPVATEEISHD
jgi:hypothetical protein